MIHIKKIPFTDIESAGVSLYDKSDAWSLKAHAVREDWDFAVNGAMFSNGPRGKDPYYYWNTTDLIVGGILNRGGNYSDKGLAFGNPWEGVSAYWSTTANSTGKKVDFIGGAPTLLVNGKVSMDMKGVSIAFVNAETQRTAIGIDKKNLYLCTTRKTKHTLHEVAQALKDAGALWAINLDGGGSTAWYEKNGEYFTQGRNIPSAFGVRLKTKRPKIILDPGHCPETPGKASPDKTYKEAEFNMDLALRIEKLLQKYPVEVRIVDVVHPDPKKELPLLVDKINQEKGDICVSLHSNAFGAGFNTANGWEIFCYKMTGDSLKLAEAIYAESHRLGLTDRGIKDGSHLYVVRETDMPCVLIETGFHTNLQDLAKLKDPLFRDLAAEVYTTGILRYFGIPIQPPAPSEPALYRVQVGAFTQLENAKDLLERLEKAGFKGYIR